MLISNTTKNIRAILDSMNDRCVLYDLAEKHPDLVGNVITTYFQELDNAANVAENNKTYMRIFNEHVVRFVDAPLDDDGYRTVSKIPAIKALRQSYNLTLADAKGTVDKWISLYEDDTRFVPDSFYTLDGTLLMKVE